MLEVSFRQISSFNPLFHERKSHAVFFSQVFMRFLLFSVPHVENSYVFNSDASQLSAAFNPDIFPPFKEILKILSPHPLSYVYIQ